MDAGGIDPAVVKIKQGTDSNGVIDGLVVPAGGVKRLHVAGRNLRRVAVHLVDEAQKHFFFFTETGGFKVAKDRRDQLLAKLRPPSRSRSTAATAAWDFSQKGQSLRDEV